MRKLHCSTTGLRARFDLEILEDRRLLSAEIQTIDLNVGATPESVVFADFTGDGLADTAVLAPSLGEIQVWAIDKSGVMSEWSTISDELADAHRIQVLDVNADGLADLGAFDGASHQFRTWVNKGDSTFEFSGGLQLADTATGLVLMYRGQGPVGEPVGPWLGGGDFGDGDDGFGGGMDDGLDGGEDTPEPHFQGDPFIGVWHDSLGAFEIVDSLLLLDAAGDGSGDGSGGGSEEVVAWPFAGGIVDLPGGVSFAIGSGGDSVALADFNHDRMPDLALTNRNDDTVSVIFSDESFEGMMDGGYDRATDGLLETATVVVGDEPVHVNVFDVNGDGFMDMLVSNAGDGTISVAFGGASGFGDVVAVEVAPALTQTFINFHAFGSDLFLLGFSADGTVTELRFNGAGLEVHDRMTGMYAANPEALPRQVVVGEFTGDGLADAAVIDQTGGRVTILSNPGEQSDDGGEGDDDYGGPPFDASDIPVAGVPDLLAESDTGESDSDDVTAYNNAGGHTLRFNVKVAHVAEDLAALRARLEAFFEQHGEQEDKDGFEYTPTIWVNLYSGEVYVGAAEVGADDTAVVVETDGFTVFREGLHNIRAGFAVGAPGLRGLVGTRSAALQIEVRVPRVEVDTSGADEGETVTIRKDDSGNTVLVLEHEDGDEDAEEINLGSFEDLPQITGSVVTVKETKRHAHASRYAAGPSEQGLVLFIRSGEGDWSGRNLTDEIDGAEPITESNLEVLTTPWGNVNMAGLNEQGELVFYWQDGRVDENGEARWNFVNMADDQLRAHGQSVPSFASGLESFVTPWGAMNVAGIDENGHLVVIWWAPGQNHWVTTDLTEHLGSTPLVGDVAAWVTPWGGINLIGLNTDGEMVAVWWTPGHDWTVSPLGDMLGAPAFVHGSLVSFISERGDTFVAGLTSDGAVAIFSFTLDTLTWDFVKFDGIAEGATLVGSLSGYYSETDATITLLAGSLEGDIYQLIGSGLDIQEPWTFDLYDSAGNDA